MVSGQECRCIAVETLQVAQHAPEARAHDIATLPDQPVQIRPRIFQSTAIQGGGKGHFAFLRRNAEMVEQGGEVRVVALVINDKTGIDRGRAASVRRVHGIGMSPDAVLFLIDGGEMTRFTAALAAASVICMLGIGSSHAADMPAIPVPMTAIFLR